MSAASLQSLMSAAQAAIAAGDWATAKSQAQQALALLISMPNTQSDGGRSLQWSRDSCLQLIAMADAELAAAAAAGSGGALGEQKMNWVPPTCD
ncbi:MAG: hypothetical protein IPM64_18050 [Phycisphaerales bacterium]|nr:hypothetical protein [Phycisphaerales bacterium]